MAKKDQHSIVIELWLQRPVEERTRSHVLNFYHWLEANRPELLPATKGGKDPYQKLQSVLSRHIVERPLV